MKPKIQNIISFLCGGIFVCAALTFQSCDKSEDGPEPLVADAGEDISASPLTTVQLDGSASGPAGSILFDWEYMSGPAQENTIAFSAVTTATPTFIPPKNGVYTFNLTITRGSEFMTDQVLVTVSGVMTLATSTQHITLSDIEPDPTKPDYKITDILTLSNNSQLTADGTNTQGIVIECSEAAGVAISSGSHTLTSIKFIAPTGWKGIMITGGSSAFTSVIIQNAGKSTFQGATEAAALTVNSGYLNMLSSVFEGTAGYDLLLLGNTAQTLTSNQFSAAKPVKAPVSMVSTLYANFFPQVYDYITLTTPGASTYATSVDGLSFRFGANKKYYIDGDFSATTAIVIESGATIFMKENTGIVSTNGITSSGTAVIQGINSSSWKGIVIGGSSSINGLTVKDAGSAVFNTGSVSTDVKAALHVNANSSLQNIQILNSKGYGISWNTPNDLPSGMYNGTFTDGLSAAIRIPYPFMHYLLRENHNNTFTMPANVAAVELTGSSSGWSGTANWRALNGNNFYLATTNILLNSNLTLSPGVRVKFASNTSVSGSGKLIATGTAVAPIVIEGSADSPGSWSGLLLEGLFNIEYCQIKNGGQSLMSGASAAAALVIKYTGSVTADNFTFKNNTVTGSTGLGVLIEIGGKDPGIDTPANNNTYSNNTAGNTLKK